MITSQVAGGVVAGLFPETIGTPVQVLIQSDSFDSLEPAYSCPNSVTIMTNYKTDNASWAGHLTAAADLYEKLDAVSGIESNDTADWHTSFDQYVLDSSAPTVLVLHDGMTHATVASLSYYTTATTTT